MTYEEEQAHLEWVRSLPEEYYGPTGTWEHYDPETETFYNRIGDALRGPEEYDPYSEGYTPFGDE